MRKEIDTRDNAPWKRRFRATSLRWAHIAHQRSDRGVVCSNQGGIFQLYAWHIPSGKLVQVTDVPTGLISGMISADGEHIYYHLDEGGNEIGHYVRVPFAGGTSEDVTPNLPPYASHQLAESRSGNLKGVTIADKDGFGVFVFLDGQEPRLLYRSDRIARGPSLSFAAETAVIASTERSGSLDNEALAYDVQTGERIAHLWDGEGASITPGAFSPVPGDSRLTAATSKSGYNRPLIWNPRTGERRDLILDGVEGEVNPWDWSPDGRLILLGQLHQAKTQLYIYDLDTDRVTRLDHPEGAIGGWSGPFFTSGGEIFAILEDATSPPRLIALDPNTGAAKRTVFEAADVPDGQPFRSISYASENGATIQGWLGVPDGEGPYPTILHTHGGPTAVMTQTYFPAAQAWLDHGFAVLTINYHGSTTFGKAFEKSIWGNLGDLEVADMAAAYQWLVDEGIAIADEVFLTGGSYGGYLTLQAIGRRPEIWAGGMAVVAIADWKLMYEDQAETLRGYQRALFVGTPDETPEATAASSPITYAQDISAPILVIQGRNDTRCPARQMEAYEEKLKRLGKAIQVHWFEAGHGSRKQEQQIEHQELMMRFAFQLLR